MESVVEIEESVVLVPRERRIEGRTRYVVGVVLVLCVVAIWVLSAQLIQTLEQDLHSDSPFFLTYFNTTLFTLYLLGFVVLPSWRVYVPFFRTRDGSVLLDRPEGMPLGQVCKLSALFCPVWFTANYAYNASLARTSVSSSTILSTTSGLFTLILSAMWLGESVSLAKILAVMSTLGGVSVVALLDTESKGEDSFLGDSLALIGAVMYAVYTVVMKRKIKDETTIRMPMFFGFLGLFNTLALLPLFPVIHWTGIETFHFPSRHALGILFLNGLVGTVVSDLLWAFSILLTTPLIATLGLSLSIPLAMGSDMLHRHASFAPGYIIGSFFVLCGFIVVNIADRYGNARASQTPRGRWARLCL